MFIKIAGIAYLRDSGRDSEFKRIGSLWFDQETGRARINLFSWRQGLCVAKPDMIEMPFLRGEITCVTGMYDDKPVSAFVGFISTNDDKHYSVVLDALPITGFKSDGLWLEVQLDDADKYKPHDDRL